MVNEGVYHHTDDTFYSFTKMMFNYFTANLRKVTDCKRGVNRTIYVSKASEDLELIGCANIHIRAINPLMLRRMYKMLIYHRYNELLNLSHVVTTESSVLKNA